MLPNTAVVMMVPMMMPLITTTSTFTCSGRFSTVGLPTDDAVTLFAAVLDDDDAVVLAVVAALDTAPLAFPMMLDDVGSSRPSGRLVDIAAMMFSMVATRLVGTSWLGMEE